MAAVIAASWLFATTAAHADDDTIAIIAIEIAGDAAPELSAQLQRSIRGGLAASGVTVRSLEDVQVELRQTPELIGCVSTTCLERVGELVDAARFVRARIDGSGAVYTIEVVLLSTRSDDGVVLRLEASCSACTITELNELASKTAARLLVRTDPEKVAVVIATEPAGANLLIDGKGVGRSPYAGSLAPGTYTVTARLDGRGVGEKEIEVVAGAAEAQSFELALPPAAAIAAGPEGQQRHSVWKWVAAGGAVAWIGTGIALIAIDGNQTCTRESVVVPGETDPQLAQCPEVYDTLVSGVLSIGVGAGLGAVSGWMFYKYSERSKSAAAARVAPTTGGGIATVRWTF